MYVMNKVELFTNCEKCSKIGEKSLYYEGCIKLKNREFSIFNNFFGVNFCCVPNVNLI